MINLILSYSMNLKLLFANETEVLHGLFTDTEHHEIVETAVEAMNTVISHDMSKNHVFTDMATRLSHKLGIMRSANPESGGGRDKPPAAE